MPTKHGARQRLADYVCISERDAHKSSRKFWQIVDALEAEAADREALRLAKRLKTGAYGYANKNYLADLFRAEVKARRERRRK